MALPSSTSAREARKPEENSQPLQQQVQQEDSTNLPRITTRPSSGVETRRSSESRLVETLLEESGTTVQSLGNSDARPLHGGPVQYRATQIAVDSKAPAVEIIPLHRMFMLFFMGRLPEHFSVPDPAGHLIMFQRTLVSLENATPGQLAHLLHWILSGCNKSNEAKKYSCVLHLLKLGVDVNLVENENSTWVAPLSMAVSNKSLPMVSLLLKAGALPDDAFRMDRAVANGHLGIVRELLKAGVDPWLSIGRPEEQIPTDRTHVSIADFYRQTGMNINAEATEIGFSTGKLSPLDLAFGQKNAKMLEQLLEAGAYVGDTIRLNYGSTEEQRYRNYSMATANAIANYQAQRANLFCGFVPYTLLHDTLQPASPAAIHTGTTSTTTSTTTTTAAPVPGSGLAQAALTPACNALIDGLYSAAAVARLIVCANNMPPSYTQAVVQALSLARALGHYSAGNGARASEVDQGIRVALVGAGQWEKHLACKAQFENLQTNIDRHQADGRTLLTTAASNGKIRMIRILVKLGARVNYPDMHGDYPLTAAAKARKPDTCSALLSLGANAGTSDLQQRSTLFHIADWLTHTDISDMATIGRIASLIEQLLGLGYDFRQPTPEDHADHAACPTVVDLLCQAENCVKLALLGHQRTQTLTQAILSNIEQRGSLPFLNAGD